MSASTKSEDRTRLDGFELEIFKLVREHATSEQWKEWLRAPLEHAAADGNMDLFTRLMDAGADGSASWWDCNGMTLLGAASQSKSEEMVMALIKAGHDVNVKFGGRQSALHVAAEAGHHGVVSILLLSGADPNAKRIHGGHTPLHVAAANGHALCVSNLVAGGADRDPLDPHERTPLHLAAKNNRVEAVEELLAAGVNADLREDGCDSALDIAAQQGHVDVLRALLRHGSSAKASGDDCLTALHRAAQFDGPDPDRDNGDVIRLLLEVGADIEAKTNGESYTPLHLAVWGKSSGTIRALLEGGADANARNRNKGTPLHLACFRSDVGAVELLLRWGADEKLTDNIGVKAEDLLGKWGRHGRLSSHTDRREADDRRIRRMLARAPADRSWRRRGWLVLARSCPDKVQLAQINGDGGGDGSGRCIGIGASRSGTGDHAKADLARLVDGVFDLKVEGVFRLLVGFL